MVFSVSILHTAEACLGLYQTSMMELSCENSQ